MCMHIVLSGETMATIIIIICSWWVDVLSDGDSLLGTTPAPSHFEDGFTSMWLDYSFFATCYLPSPIINADSAVIPITESLS